MNCKLILSPNEIHKIFPVPSAFSELTEIIKKKLKLNSCNFKLKYKDGEDELITLSSQEDLQTAVLSCEADNLKSLKIYVFIRNLESFSQAQVNVQAANYKNMKMYNGFKSRLWTRDFNSSARKTEQANFQRKAVCIDYPNIIQRCYTYPSGSPVSGGRFGMFEIEEEAASYSEGDEVTKFGDRATACNICGKETKKAKFICLICKDKMYCEECEGTSEHPHPLLKLRQNMEPYYNSFFQKKEDDHSSGKGKESAQSGSSCDEKNEKKSRTTTSSRQKDNYRVKIVSKERNLPLKIECGKAFTYSFVIKNIGKEQWPQDTQLICINGAYRNQSQNIPSLYSGEEYEIKLTLNASMESGKHLSQWRLHFKQEGTSRGFGVSFFLETLNIRKDAGNRYEESKIESAERPKEEGLLFCPKEMESLRQIYKLAETLNEMFPGDIQTKVRFVESCPRNYDIYNLVNEYLLTLRSRQS